MVVNDTNLATKILCILVCVGKEYNWSSGYYRHKRHA